MSITLIAVIVALVLGHLAPGLAATVRRHAWFAAWVRWLDARFVHPDAFWRGRWGVPVRVLQRTRLHDGAGRCRLPGLRRARTVTASTRCR